MYRTIIFFLSFWFSCSQCTLVKSEISEYKSDYKLTIKNGPTRGLGFTDSHGVKYGIVYITSTITSQYSILIDLHISFSKEYDYPIDYGYEKFNVILLPKEWNMKGIEISDSMINELPNLIGKSSLNTILQPGSNCEITIGIIRPVRDGLCSATPYALLESNEQERYTECAWLDYKSQLTNTKLNLGLKVGFCTVGGQYEKCQIITCGRVSYPK